MSAQLRNASYAFRRHAGPRRFASSYKQFQRFCGTSCPKVDPCNKASIQKLPRNHRRDVLASCANLSTSSSPSHMSGKQLSRSYHESSNSKAVNASSISNLVNSSGGLNSEVTVPLDGRNHSLSAIFLRDLCECPACVHEFTKQKLYSTTDIPADIQARSIGPSKTISNAVDIVWSNDVPGFKADHTTTLTNNTLQSILQSGTIPVTSTDRPSSPVLWDAQSERIADFEYQAYMNDDNILLSAIEQLQTHGLVFVTGVPGVEESVAAIAERIGPVKDTFYGRVWDVRTVPKAINAAYTSNDLGFHTDLLYFDNPPHVQLLHCVQSSSSGGASIFADAFKCALDLYETDIDTFNILATLPVNYHYNHPSSNMYSTTKPVFDLRPLRVGATVYPTVKEYLEAYEHHRRLLKQTMGLETAPLTLVDCLEKINWGPPFMAPFSLHENTLGHSKISVREALNDNVDRWHRAAQKFAKLLERSSALHERLMRPGECVLFNNTRVLHSRRAFDSADVGKSRWLRGTYVDKDPFFSKLKVLSYKAQQARSLVSI